MSYILDALKRADADRDRERSAVPDLHAQPDAASRHALPEARRGMAGMLAVVALAGLAALLAWWWFAAPQPAAPERPAAAQPMPDRTAIAAPAAPAAPIAPASPPVLAPPAAAAPAVAALPALATPLPQAGTPAPRRSLPLAAAPPAPASASAAVTARLPTPAELPEDIRRQLPTLTVGGSMYSASAANRMVILGGQVFREGDSPAAGLTVEQIRLKSTVLVFRGQRFELKH